MSLIDGEYDVNRICFECEFRFENDQVGPGVDWEGTFEDNSTVWAAIAGDGTLSWISSPPFSLSLSVSVEMFKTILPCPQSGTNARVRGFAHRIGSTLSFLAYVYKQRLSRINETTKLRTHYIKLKMGLRLKPSRQENEETCPQGRWTPVGLLHDDDDEGDEDDDDDARLKKFEE
ncbi:hypothetical protein MJO28_012116 [Puccinia striiformis f. sp. tritici]|uniref:Uncharacterized protein n=1 Tax=Puccinia striiformis f. sp. tritici TaxID=168172 RepID=A0ACC0E0Y8_9BASI|nr:hypothetical protein MJO28_012116 [Puccinia striiformis f. sp. tritici]